MTFGPTQYKKSPSLSPKTLARRLTLVCYTHSLTLQLPAGVTHVGKASEVGGDETRYLFL